MESGAHTDDRPAGWRLQLLGPLTIHRDGVPLLLPPSRKVRALIGYLALAPRPVARERLCELLWDLPNDPRAELRWCLSKVRALLDQTGLPRVLTHDDTIHLDLNGCEVDALEVERALLHVGAAALDAQRLRALALCFGGDFLQGLDIARSAPFSAWLIAQRRRFRALHAALLERLVRALPADADEVVARIEQWLQLAPLERRAHALLLEALARSGRLRDGDEHLAATARRFETEGQDWTPLGRVWQAARAQPAAVLRDPAPNTAPSGAATLQRRASIAVMPFADRRLVAGARSVLADGLAHDVIAQLARLRSLFVIAQGTMFALGERSVGLAAAGIALGVDYVVDGTLRGDAVRLRVDVRLTDARAMRIVWADTLPCRPGDALDLLDEIGKRIVASVASEIELAERNRALLKPPASLDAWEAHHRGLWHAYRFTREDNTQAQAFFAAALSLDPAFARPYAGLSFTHFQNAFMGWAERARAAESAYRAAAQGLQVDDRDPAVHWAMGRALWMNGRVDASLSALDTSVALSPSFALGHYMRGFIHAQSGDPETAIRAADQSRELSPFDPLLIGMLGSRAMALMRLGRHDEAADWAAKACARPNAHAHIHGIAACCLALADRLDDAQRTVAALRRLAPGYRIDDFLSTHRFRDDAAAQWRRAAARIGLA